MWFWVGFQLALGMIAGSIVALFCVTAVVLAAAACVGLYGLIRNKWNERRKKKSRK